MPLKKLTLRPGVNKENTRYTNENGWYDCDKIRFRQGTPEKIGGWQRISTDTFLGVCRSLWNWVTLSSLNLIGVGTNLKFYIERGGVYNDITPIRTTTTLTNPFTASASSSVISVSATAHGCVTNDYVTFSGAGITGLGGNITAAVLTGEFKVTVITVNTYTITVSATANATDVAGSPGGGTVVAQYQINTGPAYAVPLTGWGTGLWGYGTWGFGAASTDAMRLWSQNNFGQDLVFGPRGGGIYLWNANLGVASSTFTVTIATPAVITFSSLTGLPNGTAIQLTTTGALPTGLAVGTVYYVANVSGSTCNLTSTYGGANINTSGTQSGTHSVSSRGINITSLASASNCPIVQNYILVSDTSRYVFAFGCNALGSTVQDPMQIRWSNQESVVEWTPAATNTAGDLRLSHGSKIVTAMQARQEILVWTDSSLYSLQYVGAPVVWGSQLVGDNVSIAGENAVGYAGGVAYWMGVDKFYKYDGRTQTLSCDLRQHVFENINKDQFDQVMSGTNEGFNEVWWFYCSLGSNVVDSYVVYNYLEPNGNGGTGVWYYGSMGRTAWLDSGLSDYPIGATYDLNLVNHEIGVDDNTTGTTLPIEAYITSAEFDLDDGDKFGFVWRVLPDITFRGSSATSPQVTMYLHPMQNSGSGYNSPESVGGNASATVTRTAIIPIEAFTGQIYTRVRGRQLAMEVRSTATGVTWQLGSPRLDIRLDGRR
jgi:hypothetical protein